MFSGQPYRVTFITNEKEDIPRFGKLSSGTSCYVMQNLPKGLDMKTKKETVCFMHMKTKGETRSLVRLNFCIILRYLIYIQRFKNTISCQGSSHACQDANDDVAYAIPKILENLNTIGSPIHGLASLHKLRRPHCLKFEVAMRIWPC